MRIGVEGANGVLGRLVTEQVEAMGDEAVAVDRRVTAPERLDALVLAGPEATTTQRAAMPTIAALLSQRAASAAEVDVPAAGWWGGLGTLLAQVALDEAGDARQVHVAYGLPGTRRAHASLSPTVRSELLRAATDDATALVEGERVPERLGEGRRLAWFPAPVGPAHAVAVGGLEHTALLGVSTVRTWLAAGSMTGEWLQAVGRLDRTRGLGAVLDRRAARGGGGHGATAALRWAVVVEVRDGTDAVVRAWANGTDPVAATAALLAQGARRLGTMEVAAPTGSVLDLGPAGEQLDALADSGTLRWVLSRPEPSRR